MKRFLKNKKGITLLEGLIALVLLSIVVSGTFGVLLSSSRKSSGPDIQEEMALAIERANKLLQAYVYYVGAEEFNEVFSPNGLCNYDDEGGPFGPGVEDSGQHDLHCLLPPICNRTSYRHRPDKLLFYYEIDEPELYEPTSQHVEDSFRGAPYSLLKENENGTYPSDRLVSGVAVAKVSNGLKEQYVEQAGIKVRRVHFYIKCNGFSL